MKPYIHAKNSAKKWGGKPEDYQAIHDFFDSTKAAMPDMRHRAILHNAFGIFVAERVFGTTITNSDGKVVSVRDIGEDHVLEDIGFIPTIQDWLKDLPFTAWTGGLQKKRVMTIPLDGAKAMPALSAADVVVDGAAEWRKGD